MRRLAIALGLTLAVGVMGVGSDRPAAAQADYTAWVDLGIVYSDLAGDAYYPSVVFDANGFGAGSPLYKMWYSDGSGGVFVVTSTDGLSWSSPISVGTDLGNDAHHVRVLYDPACFGAATCGSSDVKYKIWYWDFNAQLYSICSMATAKSVDGVAWTADTTLAQTGTPLVTGDCATDGGTGWNRGSYGPVDVIYQPGASNSGSDPWSYSYVMYYDGTDGSAEVTGMAYSADGTTWTAYSTSPVLDKGTGGAWDCDDAVYGTVYRDANGYHFWYSGGGGDNGSGGCAAGDPAHEGIGYASSSDGKTWVKDAGNPIFHISDGVSYRNSRVYTPSVVDDGSGFLKMYYSARASGGPKNIGLAVLPLAAKQWVTGGGWIDSPSGAVMPSPIPTVRVSPANTQGWAFFEEVPTGTGALVSGPGTPPLGTGSANLTVDSTGREILSTVAHAGTRLDDITNLEYSTYRTSGSSALAISLQLDVDYDLTDTNTSWQGRLVYEPYYTETVTGGIWQTWDPQAGEWWASGSPGKEECPIGDPCTWSEVLTEFPDAGIRADVGLVHFKAGGPWTGGFDGAVDAFTIGVNGVDTTYDFEPADPTGRANFGFVVKYQKNASTPGGNLLFQFKAADLNLKSTSFDWLVVAGPQASFQGTGAVNGVPGYRFKVDAKDGDLAGGQPDHLKIKIWNPTGGLIYQADEDLAGGSIVVHAK